MGDDGAKASETPSPPQQKRPNFRVKETYLQGKRDLHDGAKASETPSPPRLLGLPYQANQPKHSFLQSLPYLYGKRGLHTWQKRPIVPRYRADQPNRSCNAYHTYMAKEAYIHGKRDLLSNVPAMPTVIITL